VDEHLIAERCVKFTVTSCDGADVTNFVPSVGCAELLSARTRAFDKSLGRIISGDASFLPDDG
jgi:hypothetical protein